MEIDTSAPISSRKEIIINAPGREGLADLNRY